VTVGAYAGAAVLAGLLFYFFNPAGAGDCSFNISVISLTLLLGLLVSAVSMSPYVRAPCRRRTCGAPRVLSACRAPGPTAALQTCGIRVRVVDEQADAAALRWCDPSCVAFQIRPVRWHNTP